MSIAQDSGPPKVSLLYDPKVRSIAYQVILCAVIVFLAYSAVRNAADNLARAKIASGFGFWNQTAGFDISQTLIEYSANASTYGRAFWVGLLNTLLVAAIGIVLATIVGFLVGIARLSKNFLLAKLSAGYVELIRNVPLLLQLLFWYNAVLKALPDMRDSWTLRAASISTIADSSRHTPSSATEANSSRAPSWSGSSVPLPMRAGPKKQDATGEQSPVGLVALGLIIGLPLIAFFAMRHAGNARIP